MHMKKIFQRCSLFLLLFISSVAWSQTKNVSGKVIGENGIAISKASVMVKGTNIGTTTDETGNFSFSVPENAQVLVISSVGFGLLEEPINGRSIINVTLKPGVQELETVVVAAFGIKREEKALGYATQKVSGDLLQKVAGTEVATSMTGKVAGLLVKNPTDFAAIPDITLRGERPLLVIDGIAYANKSFTDISAEDIESLSVLKGATAAAIYGLRGANGAIIITTKNGSNERSGVTVNFASNTMFSAGFLAIPEKQGVYGRGNNMTYDKLSDGSWGTKMNGQILNQWDPFAKAYRDYEYLPVGKDNFQNFLEQGYVTNNNLNVSYREGAIALRSSLNWTQNKGLYPNSTLDKYTYAFGGDVNLGKFKLSSNLGYSYRHSPNQGNNSYTAYDPMYALLIWTAADYNVLDYKDNYWIEPGQKQNFTYKSLHNNPYFDRYQRTKETSRQIFNADMSISYEFSKWFKTSLLAGTDFYTDKGELRTAWGSYVYTGNEGVPGNSSTWNGFMTGNYNIGQTQGNSINTDLLFSGNGSLTKKIRLDYLAGGTVFFKRDDNLNAATNGGLSVPDFFSLKASVSPAVINQSTVAQQVNSVFGRVGLSYDNWAFIEGTGRNDWSSTLPSSTRSYFYPSLSTSFVISEFLPGTKSWLDLLKIRGSWAVSKTVPGIYESTANSVFAIYPGTWNTLNGAAAPSNLYPGDIKPASAKTTEVGLQSMFLKNRIMFDLSYYDKRFQDAIIRGPLSPSSGYTGAYTNSQEVISRRGWEIILNAAVIKKTDWRWDLGVNWTTYASYYTKLDPIYSTKRPWVAVGERADAFFSRAYLRVPETGELIFNSSGRLQNSQYDTKFGNRDPNYVWGVNSNLRYKNFNLFISFDGVRGGLMNTRTESYMWQAGVHPDGVTDARAKDVETPGSKNFLGQGVKVISGSVSFDPVGNIISDTRQYAPNDVYTTYKQYVNDLHGSSAWGGNGTEADTYSKTFMKFRELSLTYDIPTKYLSKIHSKGASIGFVGQNIWLKAKDFKYSDPDGGIEDFSDPSVRYLGFNLKFTF